MVKNRRFWWPSNSEGVPRWAEEEVKIRLSAASPYFWHFPVQLLGRIRQLSLCSQLITYMERFPQLEVMATLTSHVFTKVHGPHGVLSAVGCNSSTFGVSTVEGSTHLTRELPSHVRLGSGATNQCQHLCVEKTVALEQNVSYRK